MSGRIIRRDSTDDVLEPPPIGKLHIGKRATTANGREYPMSVDYFIPAGKYADLFTRGCGERPSTIQVIFPSDDFGKVCNERLTCLGLPNERNTIICNKKSGWLSHPGVIVCVIVG